MTNDDVFLQSLYLLSFNTHGEGQSFQTRNTPGYQLLKKQIYVPQPTTTKIKLKMCKKTHNKTDALNRTENYNQRKVTMENN